ncbi:YSIRK-type signal peptide-containing protein [Dolosigranulum pigrum]|uniref:YSIRK-type signal peptide-containing protein n=1 Tax=Dolosigranulum pigrum TaxID=29394 RepID=UPI001AD88451|nr:YSIRK-type signal peptide-containing protein [Dolosigranulum pigrum]QTJ36949.1 YSIRK-type signal peptide-containing protein [Dolosigranulum pigrum]
MVGKNNKTGQFRRQANEDKRYTLKKLSVGLASVALGTVLFLGQANAVNAEEVDSDIEDNLPDDFTDEEAAERRAEEDILLTENENNAEVSVEKTVFQFSYMEAGTGKKMDGFFGEYVNANEAEKAFRMYANEAGYSLENIQFDNHNSFTATIAQNSTDRYVEAAKSRARNLINDLDGLTNELKADYLEQVGAAVSVEEVETVYNEAVEMANQQKEEANRYVAVAKDRARQLIKGLTNLTNDQKTHYLAKVEAAISVAEVEAIHAEAENVVNETPAPNRFVKIARDHARQLINKLGNLYDNQKADYIKRVEAADSVKAIEGILEEAQKHVNSAKGGENGQAPTQPDKPSYDGDMTPTPEAPAESELDQAKMKATEDIKALGYFTAKEKQDLLGRVKDYDNTGDIHFIVTKAQQENEKRHQLHRKLLELQFGTNPNNSLPEAGKPQDANPGDILDPQADIERDIAKAQALEAIAELSYFTADEISAIETDINNAETTEEVTKIVKDAQEENATRQQNHKHSIEEQLEKQPNDTLPETGKPQDANPEDLLKPEAGESKPGTDDKQPEQPAESELDRAKAGALADIAELKNFSEKEKQDLIDRVNSYDNVGDIDFIITKAQEQDDARYKKQQNDAYDALEAKADKTLHELLDLTKKVDEAAGGEVDQDLLESIQAKATELGMVLAEIQQHISSLPEAEAQEATQLVKELQALLEKIKEKYSFEEVTPAEEAKEGAKAYLNKEFGKDLNDMQREAYAKAIDKIKNDDPDYEKKVQDIVQVAIAEVLVSKAESGHHIENAKKALAAASQETEGGKLIDAKDQLIKNLQERLNKVTHKPQAPKVTPEVKAAKDKLEDKIQKGLADKDLREKFLKELDKKASVEDINALQAEVEKEIKVQGVKDGAKSYLTNGIADQDLSKEQKAKYEKALSKISSADEDYEQIVQDITQVAIAESLVARAEKGHHIEAAEEALTNAAKKTKGGQLIEGKDELIMSLQTRLAKVISEQDQNDQTPPVEKQPEKEQTPPVEKEKEQAPASEKEETPQESEEVRGKRGAAKQFIGESRILNDSQKEFYLEQLDSAKSVEQITEIVELFDAENILERTKQGALSKDDVLNGVTAKTNKVTSEQLLAKKAELLAEAKKIVGGEHQASPTEEEQAPKATFAEKQVELTGIISEWNMLYKDLATEGGKKVATKEQHAKLTEISNRFKKVFAEWDSLAETDVEKKSVEGLKTTLYHVYTTIPNVK